MAKGKARKTRRQRAAELQAAGSDGMKPMLLHLLSYEITAEPMHDDRYPHLPEDDVERLHDLALSDPKAAIPELLNWIHRYPDVPTLRNYLAAAYGQSGDVENYERIALETFRLFPDYLFARLSIAELLLRRRDYEAVADLLNHAFDIGLFCPDRKRFHVTEYSAFAAVVGLYHVGVGDLEAAGKVLDALKQVTPDAPGTRRLEHDLRVAYLERGLDKLKKKMRALKPPQ
jgi:tetratricopeptide (TPR) repeat protein